MKKIKKRIFKSLLSAIVSLLMVISPLLSPPPVKAFSATGGTITTSGAYTIHTFTTNGTFTPDGSGDVEYLVIGGGGGSSSYGGGGGAGGYRTGTLAVTGQAYPITVGAGGPAGSNGSNSVFSSITATGGGRGGGSAGGAQTGGSGGGSQALSNPPAWYGAAGTSGQGNSGGNSTATSSPYGGGGGGGAGGAGANGTSVGGAGGAGLSSSITGSAVTRAGGGGGATYYAGTGGAGGSGGGGAGSGSGSGSNGTANTGGGGGGGQGVGGYAGGSGGSGIVIIRYLTPTPPAPTIGTPAILSVAATGGTITESGGYTIHTFTSSGTFTPDSSYNAEILVIGGGGGGGAAISQGAGTVGGGGGAGGIIYNTSFPVTAQAYTVTVGAGGAGGALGANGTSGGNSVFGNQTATGGGGGGLGRASAVGNAGLNGGSGGGGGGGTANAAGGTGTAGQGNAGSDDAGGGIGGGGGGAGTAAGPSSGTGGAGSAYYGTTYSTGGNSSTASGLGVIPPSRNVNTGDGGYGGWGSAGANGGSGIVIVRYPTPVSPLSHAIRWNFTDSANNETGFKVYDSGATVPSTGGTITESGGYTIHKFTSSGTFTPAESMNIEVLVVGGGGSGGSGYAGGGAGGVLYESSHAVTAQDYTVTVGNGGAAGGKNDGQNSVFDTMTAIGGGGAGIAASPSGGNGGSGGGRYGANLGGSAGTGTAGPPRQGYDGGTGGDGTITYTSGGGGGGAGGGGASVGCSGGTGGAGVNYSSIFGTNVGASGWFAGGGAGNCNNPVTYGTATAGGGAQGAGTANTGGGGGGVLGTGYAGGSGIVLIRYPTPSGSDPLVTCASANLAYCDETGLSANTQYTRKVVAYNGAGNSSYSSTATIYTLANAPSTPTVSSAGSTTANVIVAVNSNPAATEFAIQETGSTNYVNKTTGALQGAASWGTYAEFGGGSGMTVTGLSPNTQYTFKTKARNANNIETSFGSTASAYTQAATPPAPTVNARSKDTPTVQNITPLLGSNPSNTEIAIYKEVGITCDGTGGVYLNDDGSENGATPVWQTAANWGTAGTVTATLLAQDRQYSFCVVGRNGDNIATSFGDAGTYNSGVPGLSGDHTITQDSSFLGFTDGNDAARLVHGVDAGTGSTNTAKLRVESGVLTVNSNETIAAGSFELAGGSIAIANGGQLKVGVPLWVVDADSDGYPNEGKIYAQTDAPVGGRRRSEMTRMFLDCDGLVATPNGCWRKKVTLTYSGTTLTNHEVVFTVDTATAIATGKMQGDCGDIRIKDSDETTALSYWIEGGCNTTTTQIWARVPSIPDGGKTIFMDYHGGSVANGFEAWSGTFTLMNTAACPAGWTQNADFDNRFSYGAATYGTTGGSSSHSHAQASCSVGASGTTSAAKAQLYQQSAASTTHGHSGYRVDINSATNILPPYLNVVMCKKADLVIPASFITLFDTTVPSGWTRFSTLDSKFPRGAVTYGGTGGASTHSHSTGGGYLSGVSSSGLVVDNGSNQDIALHGHYHTSSSGTTGAGNNTPPYLNMIFGQADAQTVGTAGMISIVDVLPPLGWTRFSSLDSKFPRGAAAYGGTGGTTTHTHSVTITGGSANQSSPINNTSGLASRATHTHSCTDSDVGAQSNLPPYVNAIYAKRNTPSPSTAVGAEGPL